MSIDLIGEQRVADRLRAMIRAGRDMSPAMASIGELLLNSTRQRFDSETDPDGQPWAPLSPATLSRKRRNRDKVLTERGYLRASIAYRLGTDYVEIGSPLVYASTQQFGASKGQFGATARGPIPWGDIPARPFLGLSDRDRSSITAEIIDFITRR